MSDKLDPHTCGACGYDGGLKDAQQQQKLKIEILSLEKKAAQDLFNMERATQDSQDTRQGRHLVTGIVIVVLSIIMSVTCCNTAVEVVERSKILDPKISAYTNCLKFARNNNTQESCSLLLLKLKLNEESK